eukprot:scaffold811_cov214-Alexandrium_tamarense.AAC.3
MLILQSSSWIPTHPSTNMTDTVVDSVHNYLKGLSPSTPIFITIDTFVHGTSILSTKDDAETLTRKLEALEEYTKRLFETYLSDTRVHILPAMSNLHMCVDHTALIGVMKEVPNESEFHSI